jgi:nicotinamidase-related amidase
MKSHTALVLIDMQQGNFTGSDPIVAGNHLLNIAKELIRKARRANIPIIYILNNGGKGDPDEVGTPGWEIHSSIMPLKDDMLIQKITPDAFHKTNLKDSLNERNIENLVVMGLQTEYCIDTTCRHGSLLGYNILLVKDGHSTWDSDILSAQKIIAHHNSVLGNWFVKLEEAKYIDFPM